MYLMVSRICVFAVFRRRNVDGEKQICQEKDLSSATHGSGNPGNFFIMDDWLLIILKECKASAVARFTTLLTRFTTL